MRQEVFDETRPKVIDARAVIGQAKGALMLVYGINGEQPFNLLRWRSQEHNIKVRELASQLIAEMEDLTEVSTALRTQFRSLVLDRAGTDLRRPRRALDGRTTRRNGRSGSIACGMGINGRNHGYSARWEAAHDGKRNRSLRRDGVPRLHR